MSNKGKGDQPRPDRYQRKTRSVRYYKKKSIYKELSFVEKARYLAISNHNKTNHYYNQYPYEVHLNMVIDFAMKYLYLIEEEKRDNVLAGCWCHDLMGEARVRYNEILKTLNEDVAELVRKLTSDPRGRSRRERLTPAILKEISESKEATFIKVCERIANTVFARVKNKPMYGFYRDEYMVFVESLYRPDLITIFKELEKVTLGEL
jgi:(p)ppGpp synthase/HD superfamily hydrolase